MEEIQKNDGPQSDQPVAVTAFTIYKMSDGSVKFNFGGPDSDVLGLIEFGKMIISERLRAQSVKASESATKAMESSSHPTATGT